MHMNICQSGDHIGSFCIDHIVSLKIRILFSVYVIKFSFFHRNICRYKFLKIGIKYFCVFDQQMNLLHIPSPSLDN